MYIDSHVHYARKSFDGTFSYLSWQDGTYQISQGQREDVLQAALQTGVSCWIEPAVELESNEALLELARRFPGRAFPAVGLHPTRCAPVPLSQRHHLRKLAQTPGVVAIGETGLDYHHPRNQQHRLRQLFWFRYQLELARGTGLPLILHIRDADHAALRVLRLYRGRLSGGVVHCFRSDWATARQYLELGYHIGLGGSILQPEEVAAPLWEAVRRIPLERILLETDGPYVLPDCAGAFSRKKLRKTRNTSLIVPRVAEKIASLKGTCPEEVERVTTRNAIALFSLPVSVPDEKRDSLQY